MSGIPEGSVEVAKLTLTLNATPDGDLMLDVSTPPDDATPYITHLGMLEMAKTMIGELE